MAWCLDLDPSTNSKITIWLLKNVNNAEEIQKRLFDGHLKCCIIKASLIIDPFQIAVAANKALVAESLTTKTIFTEILFNLSISKNITSSLQTFGISATDKELLIVSIDNLKETSHSLNFIEGDEVDMKILNQFTDVNMVKKIYKISDVESKTMIC
ncbi:hypothetical protein HHI36_008147 [Cryptolaemus montrouzieri]|uniref:Uncharacterized protein n=1 Tax=Cryptolaemus montrouzieri TaxID=559131 RepID=A0ABD2MRI6_9CUCU